MPDIAALREKALSVLNQFAWFPPLLARVTTGWVFVESGWGKLHNLDKVTEFFQSLGIPAAELQAPFVATTEFVGGLLVLVGLLTRLASVPLAATMVVAIITAKASDITAFSDIFGLSEFLYIVLFIWLIVAGPGAVSVDHFLARRLPQLAKRA